MTKEKQIKEIQEEIIRWGENADRTGNYGYALSEHLVDQGYRKIYDDNQRQCTCYALGCQMAEELERKVARGIFEEIEKIAMHNVTSSHGIWLLSMGEVAFAELKKKYTESEKDDG